MGMDSLDKNRAFFFDTSLKIKVRDRNLLQIIGRMIMIVV